MNKKIVIISLATLGTALILIIIIKAFKRMKYKKWSSEIAKLSNYGEEQQRNILTIIETFFKYDSDLKRLAYVLATARHESRFRPVRETFASSDAVAIANLAGKAYASIINGFAYFGRGFVQLTWLNNYIKMGNRLKINLADNPALALEPDIAAKILVVGMLEGMFTGAKLSQYVSDKKTDFENARRVVNGTDKADLIASYARTYLNVLEDIEPIA